MVADLFQPGEQGQHLTVALPARRPRNGIEGVFHRLAVQGFLLLAQPHPFAQFHFFRQVGNDRFVGLQPAQDERAHPAFQVS